MLKLENKIYISWDDVKRDVETLCTKIFMDYPNIDSVMGLPRGGLIPAVLVSHELGLPWTMQPGRNTLVIDDINDTGHTLNDAPGVYHAVLHHKPTSKFKPNLYAREVGEEWLVYPWERSDSKALPDYLKQVGHLSDSHYIGGLTMPKGAKTPWWKKMSK